MRNMCMLSCFGHVQLCDPTDWSLPDFSAHGIIQAKILEWVVMSSSRGSSQPRIKSASLMSPALVGGFFTTSATGEYLYLYLSTHTHSGILFTHYFIQKEWNPAIDNNKDEPWGHYAKWNKSDKERQTLTITFIYST